MSPSLEERGFALERIDGVLSLRDLKDPSLQPLSVDFSSPQLLHRLKTSGKNQPLAKAVGLHLGKPFVIDTTAGLGTDSIVLAALGCRVRSFERNETVFALLQDGHARLKDVDQELASRISFENGDALEKLASVTERPDVVYLDPMYPEETHSSALPKKTMQMFRRLLDGDKDSEDLWSAAMKVAKKRVVVKRPLKAPSLGDRKPTHSFEGKTARFDLYLADQ